MPYFPQLNEGNPSRQNMDAFGGINYSQEITEYELADSVNLTTANYPRLSNIRMMPRVNLQHDYKVVCEVPIRELSIDGNKAECFSLRRYNDNSYRLYVTFSHGEIQETNITNQVSCTLTEYDKYVTFGAYIVFYNSDNAIYINTADFSDSGDVTVSWTAVHATTTSTSLRMCDENGNSLSYIAGRSEPTYGTTRYWLDTSDAPYHMYRWVSTGLNSGNWVLMPRTYMYIQFDSDIPSSLRDGDTIALSSELTMSDTPETNDATVIAKLFNEKQTIVKIANTNVRVGDKWTDYELRPRKLVFEGILTQSYNITSDVTVSRDMPKVDYLVESQNRLWGCYYGETEEHKVVNEIYASALGDFRSWYNYKGISTDSYTASIGAPGKWTGAIEYNGVPMFFKKDCVYKIGVSSSGAHSIVQSKLTGVKENNLIANLDGTLFYAGFDGVYAYDSTVPSLCSKALGRGLHNITDIVTADHKLYVRQTSTLVSNRLKDGWFVFDPTKNIWQYMWLPESENSIEKSFQHDGYFVIYANDKSISSDYHSYSYRITENLTDLEPKQNYPWMAAFSVQGYYDPDQKYVSRFDLRMALDADAEVDFFIKYDDEDWEFAGHIHGDGISQSLRSFVLPIRPRRCDHYQFKMQGTGEMRLYGMSKIYESGSDVV